MERVQLDCFLKGSARRGIAGGFQAMVAMMVEPQLEDLRNVDEDAARLADLHGERPATETLMFFDLEPADIKVLRQLALDELRSRRVLRQLEDRLAGSGGRRRWWRKAEYESELKVFIEATNGFLSIKEQIAFVRYFESIGRYLDEVSERQERAGSVGARYIPAGE